jgi:hypothetical protein|tara:strand:- start:227 stop:1267 length:1041 start_codon:yes stop_codon:yes gene_type:complete
MTEYCLDIFDETDRLVDRMVDRKRIRDEQTSLNYGANKCARICGSLGEAVETEATPTIVQSGSPMGEAVETESTPTIVQSGSPMAEIVQFEIVQLELSNKSNQTLANTKPAFYDMSTNKIYEVVIPDNELSKLTHVTLRTMADLKQIPTENGCYWIITNEPVNHCFNSGSHCPGVLSDGFSVVYNGVAVQMRGRAKQHLLRQGSRGSFGSASGISVDLLKEIEVKNGVSKSHVKWMWQDTNAAKKHKLPKILKGPPTNKYYQNQRDASKQEIMDTLNLSQSEKEMAADRDELIFKNGIDVTDEKHAGYTWKFVFVPISNQGLRDSVERNWRVKYGVPSLCTYKDGR